jgi:hypothetical protein
VEPDPGLVTLPWVELNVPPREQVLVEIAAVVADIPGTFDAAKKTCIGMGLFVNSGRPTNDYTEGEDLSELGRKAWLAAVDAAMAVLHR